MSLSDKPTQVRDFGDQGAGNGAPGGAEARDTLMGDVMNQFKTTFKDADAQVESAMLGFRNGLNVATGSELEKPAEVAEVKQSKGDNADLSKEALAFTMNDEAKRAAAGRGQALVFDNSIYPPTSATAAADADKWLDERVNAKKAA